MAPTGSMPTQFCVQQLLSRTWMRNASAGGAIRISAKLARRDLGLQIRRQGLSGDSKFTILWTVWWRRPIGEPPSTQSCSAQDIAFAIALGLR